MKYAQLVKPSEKVKLKEISCSPPKGLDQLLAEALTSELHDKIEKLQEGLYAASHDSLLMVLQGRDAAGKDGSIKKLSTCLNVQHANVVSFKQPTSVEKGHDFLWRVHPHVPLRGQISIFNRSHYEDVLVARVHKLVSEKVWQARYKKINQFESLIHSENGTSIVKFYLHISKKEQEQRLLDREKDVDKAWKLSSGDWKERELWGDYTEAFEDALSECSTEIAPWYIIPADKKWYRDLCLAEVIYETLQPMKKVWHEILEEIGSKAKAELAGYRSGLDKKQ